MLHQGRYASREVCLSDDGYSQLHTAERWKLERRWRLLLTPHDSLLFALGLAACAHVRHETLAADSADHPPSSVRFACLSGRVAARVDWNEEDLNNRPPVLIHSETSYLTVLGLLFDRGRSVTAGGAAWLDQAVKADSMVVRVGLREARVFDTARDRARLKAFRDLCSLRSVDLRPRTGDRGTLPASIKRLDEPVLATPLSGLGSCPSPTRTSGSRRRMPAKIGVAPWKP